LRTRPRTLTTTLVLAVPLTLAMAACSGVSSAGPSKADAHVVKSGSAIVIGTTLPLSGSLGGLGQPLEAGYQQEIADVNAAGGIAGGGTREKLKLVVLDNGGDPDRAASQAAELVQQDHAVALLGSATPQIVMPTAVVAEQLRVPLVTSQMPVEAFASGDKTGWTYSWDLFYDERQQAADGQDARDGGGQQEGRAVHRQRAGQRGGAAAVRGRVQGRRPRRGR
jgi:branched-chain amino acid transport system substrate-binding protein